VGRGRPGKACIKQVMQNEPRRKIMKKIMIITGLSLVLALLTSSFSLAGPNSGQAIIESGQASMHSSAASVHTVIGSGQAVSAVAAMPFALSHGIGEVSGEIADNLLDAATTPIGVPLTITDETVTVGPPPDLALRKGEI